MARGRKERELRQSRITVIGEGLTERCYFDHLRHKHIPTKLPNPLQYILDRFHNSVAQCFRDSGSSSIPSTSCGTKGPSLHSKNTLPDSRDSTLCHTFLGMSTP